RDGQGADADLARRRGRRRGRRRDLRRGRRDRAGSRPHGRERGLHAVTLARALVLVLLLVAPAAPWARAAEPTREEALQALAGAADAEARQAAGSRRRA